MTTISAKSLKSALAKARNVGLVEEAFSIEGCQIVLRNLRPDEHAAILQDCQGLEDMEYLHCYQKGHIARAIVELDGVDFREVDKIQLDEDQGKSIKVEKYQYLLDHVISTWGREAVWVAFRKFSDVVQSAEEKAKQGITFLTPDETSEEKYRRLLLEAKSAEDEMPDTLVDSILGEMGLMRKVTAAEVQRTFERASQLQMEQQQKQSEATLGPQAEEAPAKDVVSEVPKRKVQDPHAALQQAMAARKVQPEAVKVEAPISNVPQLAEDVDLDAYEYAPPVGPSVDKDAAPKSNIGPMTIDAAPQGGINPRFKPATRV